MLANRRRISSEGVAHTIGVEHETGHACSSQKRRRFLGGRWSREARKSAGISTESARAKRSSQEPGLRERMMSPVLGSLRMKTSREVNRKSDGKRTAWLRPFLNSLAILSMAEPPRDAERVWHLAYTMVYHKFFENKWECDPCIRKSTWLSGA